MKRIEATLATSHVDLHGERVSREALEDAAVQINTQYVPIGIEHDPRVPPKGRLVFARVEDTEDGETALRGTLEFFEGGDSVPFLDSGREIPLSGNLDTQLHVVFDRSFDDPESIRIIREMSDMLGTEPQMEGKKALEPVSVFIVAGAFVLGGIAEGFLRKIGGNIADTFLERLKALLGQPQKREEQLFCLRVYFEYDGRPLEAEIIATNPTPEELNYLFSSGLEQLDRLIPATLGANPNIRRLVFELRNEDISFSFGIRRDAFPIVPQS